MCIRDRCGWGRRRPTDLQRLGRGATLPRFDLPQTPPLPQSTPALSPKTPTNPSDEACNKESTVVSETGGGYLADTRAEAANYGRDKWEDEMATYGKKAQETVKEVMEKFKKGELKSGKDGEIVTDRKQAVAIGLSEAREKGAKVPEPPKK